MLEFFKNRFTGFDIVSDKKKFYVHWQSAPITAAMMMKAIVASKDLSCEFILSGSGFIACFSNRCARWFWLSASVRFWLGQSAEKRAFPGAGGGVLSTRHL
jgi:hypothetical protein